MIFVYVLCIIIGFFAGGGTILDQIEDSKKFNREQTDIKRRKEVLSSRWHNLYNKLEPLRLSVREIYFREWAARFPSLPMTGDESAEMLNILPANIIGQYLVKPPVPQAVHGPQPPQPVPQPVPQCCTACSWSNEDSDDCESCSPGVGCNRFGSTNESTTEQVKDNVLLPKEWEELCTQLEQFKTSLTKQDQETSYLFHTKLGQHERNETFIPAFNVKLTPLQAASIVIRLGLGAYSLTKFVVLNCEHKSNLEYLRSIRQQKLEQEFAQQTVQNNYISPTQEYT